MSQLICEICGHQWIPVASDHESSGELMRKSIKAAAINKTGPFCELCRHLIMAYRVAKSRGMSLSHAVDIRIDYPKFRERAE